MLITRSINYENAYVIYKVKLSNNLEYPIAQIKITPYVNSELFLIDKESDLIGLLEPKNSRTVTFKLRPQKECGNVTISGNVKYYDTKLLKVL